MEISYDPAKNDKNIRERGLSFSLATDFEWDTALYWSDERQDYQENRICSLGLIGGRLHSMVFTHRENSIRIISLRRANTREQKRFQQEKQI